MEAPQRQPRAGPLAGFTVIEMAGLGPVPLAGLMLAEMGADVVRIERLAFSRPFLNLSSRHYLDRHGRTTLRVDLKDAAGRDLVRRLAAKADVLVEGFRPGVMERLGLGPEALAADNPGLVYGRMTGYGQSGPLASRPGHDINYLAYSGVLHAIGSKGGKPVPPLNLIADFGGGTMFLIAGVLAALLERSRSGKGQVIDAAMIDGASMLAAPMTAYMAAGLWSEQRGSNMLDSGCPFYDTYETADGGHVAIGCLEPVFFAEFARLLPLDQDFVDNQFDRSRWDAMRAAIAARFRTKPRDEWMALFEDSEACVAPVLALSEARAHPHHLARAGTLAHPFPRPAPAPRFSRTPATAATEGNRPLPARFAIGEDELEALARRGVIGR